MSNYHSNFESKERTDRDIRLVRSPCSSRTLPCGSWRGLIGSRKSWCHSSSNWLSLPGIPVPCWDVHILLSSNIHGFPWHLGLWMLGNGSCNTWWRFCFHSGIDRIGYLFGIFIYYIRYLWCFIITSGYLMSSDTSCWGNFHDFEPHISNSSPVQRE